MKVDTRKPATIPPTTDVTMCTSPLRARSQPIRVCLLASRQDDTSLRELQKHLAILVRQGRLTLWHERCMLPGDRWRWEVREHIRTADVIVLLVSPDFVASDDHDLAVRRALRRCAREEARVIPVIVRPVDWRESPFGGLQSLPRSSRAVTEHVNQDAAWRDVAREIRDVAYALERMRRTGRQILTHVHQPAQ